MEITKVFTFLRILLFNIIETVIIFFLGNIFNVEYNIKIMFMVTFFLTRMIIGKPKHYNKAYRCALWSCLVFVSLYSLSSLDIFAIILLTIFTGFISTGRADINDMFMWNNKSNSKYADIEEYVKYNELNNDLIEFENKLKEKDNVSYLIYKYRLKEHKSFSEISNLLDLDNPRIVEKLDNIAFTMRLYCGI